MADDLLLWLDLETTGTDEEHDCILEIGCVLTTTDLRELGHFQQIVQPSDEALGRLLRNNVVRGMHDGNGLLDLIVNPADDAHDCLRPLPIHDAAKVWLDWLDMHARSFPEPPGLVLAGSGVSHFDRRFLKRWMPQVDRRLRHWCIDVGVIRRAHEMWTGEPLVHVNDDKPHRALDDALIHLTEARAFRAHWTGGA